MITKDKIGVPTFTYQKHKNVLALNWHHKVCSSPPRSGRRDHASPPHDGAGTTARGGGAQGVLSSPQARATRPHSARHALLPQLQAAADGVGAPAATGAA